MITLRLLCFVLLICISETNAQSLWTGPEITFSKPDFSDWTLPVNQDRISDSIWLTRADNRGIFNIRTESEYDRIDRSSPEDTEWANGTIADGINNLTFGTWHQSNPTAPHFQIGVNKVLHLISEDIYIDITFTSWTQGGGGSGTGFGGGFSYRRSTDPSLGTTQNQAKTLSIFPNPTLDLLYIKDATGSIRYTLLNSLGETVMQGNLEEKEAISLKNLAPGIYIMKMQADHRSIATYKIIRE